MNLHDLFRKLSPLQRQIVLAGIGLVGLSVLLLLITVVAGGGNGRMHSGTYEESVIAVGSMPMPPMMDRDEAASYGGDGYTGSPMGDMAYSRQGMTMPAPLPTQPYVPDLEAYETTDYRVHARTSDFDAACSLLGELKRDTSIHFRALNESLNHCSANFFVDANRANEVRDRLSGIDGVVVERSTESVTRTREDILDQVDVLRDQLAHTEATLATVTAQYKTITELAYQEGEPAVLNRTVQSQFEMLDSLNQRRLWQATQLKSLLQQSADLEERIGKEMFSVSFERASTVEPKKYARAWSEAFKDLKDYFVMTLIGLTAHLGIFALFTLKVLVYGFLLLILARVLYHYLRKYL